MIFLTSINPNSNQKATIDSWFNYGSVLSFNTKEEILVLKKKHPKVFFFTIKQRYCPIKVILDNAKNGTVNCIINDDILISNNSFEKIINKVDSNNIVIGKRWNYDDNSCSIEPWGIDAVAFSGDLSKKVSIPLDFCLGKPWWDYCLPYSLLKSGFKISAFNDKCLMHKKHKSRWNNNEWIHLCITFLKHHGVEIPKVNYQELSEQTNIIVHREIYEKQEVL